MPSITAAKPAPRTRVTIAMLAVRLMIASAS